MLMLLLSGSSSVRPGAAQENDHSAEEKWKRASEEAEQFFGTLFPEMKYMDRFWEHFLRAFIQEPIVYLTLFLLVGTAGLTYLVLREDDSGVNGGSKKVD